MGKLKEKNMKKKIKATFLNPRPHYFFKMNVWRQDTKDSGDYKAPWQEKGAKKKGIEEDIWRQPINLGVGSILSVIKRA